MTKRLALGVAAMVVALGGFGTATAVAQPTPAPPPDPAPTMPAPGPSGMDTESMISQCTERLPADQRGPAADWMRPMMAGNTMMAGNMGSGPMGNG